MTEKEPTPFSRTPDYEGLLWKELQKVEATKAREVEYKASLSPQTTLDGRNLRKSIPAKKEVVKTPTLDHPVTWRTLLQVGMFITGLSVIIMAVALAPYASHSATGLGIFGMILLVVAIVLGVSGKSERTEVRDW